MFFFSSPAHVYHPSLRFYLYFTQIFMLELSMVSDYGLCSKRKHTAEETEDMKGYFGYKCLEKESVQQKVEKLELFCYKTLLSSVTILIALSRLLLCMVMGLFERGRLRLRVKVLFSTSFRQAPLCLMVSVNLCSHSSSSLCPCLSFPFLCI